jgi:putative restriction endonuclease
VNGYVAVTDQGWYETLLNSPGPKDANFWRPSTTPVNLDPHTPFFFKLKAPHNVIAGFGYFESFSILPDWLAWETFGSANGVDSLATLKTRLATIQQRARIEADPRGQIGCCLIAEARFFERHEWVGAPKDWKPRTVVGARYDLASGEGARILAECLARTSKGTERAVSRPTPPGLRVAEGAPRYGSPVVHTPRLGQSIFRIRVIDAYQRACAVTNEHSLPVLEAAHIKPYSEDGQHAVDNGILLRTDLHRLFDKGFVTIDEDSRFVVGRKLKEEWENGRSYYELHGREISLPSEPTLQPSSAALDWHRQHVFLG